MEELAARGHEAVGATRREMPLTDFPALRAQIEAVRPDAVIHCAAYTAVDRAEAEKETCMIVNGGATREIAAACRDIGAKLLYLSTDYVFPGTGEDFYEPDDAKGPQNAYGLSKLAGEEAVEELLTRYFIVRISWVFGVNGKNFIKTMLRLAETHDTLTVVDDQIGSPTYTRDLARLLVDMVESERYGIYHATRRLAGRARALPQRTRGMKKGLPHEVFSPRCPVRREFPDGLVGNPFVRQPLICVRAHGRAIASGAGGGAHAALT